MIPPVQMDPVRGKGQYDPDQACDYNQVFSRCVEVKATLPTAKLDHLTLELHPPTRRWESINPTARI